MKNYQTKLLSYKGIKVILIFTSFLIISSCQTISNTSPPQGYSIQNSKHEYKKSTHSYNNVEKIEGWQDDIFRQLSDSI